MLASAFLVLLATFVTSKASSIYVDGHWDRCTKLTKSNFDIEVKNAIDSGKTMFVRFIASEGYRDYFYCLFSSLRLSL